MRKIRRRIAAALTIFAMAVTAYSPIAEKASLNKVSAKETKLQNPVSTNDQTTAYDTVCFGTYPNTQITEDSDPEIYKMLNTGEVATSHSISFERFDIFKELNYTSTESSDLKGGGYPQGIVTLDGEKYLVNSTGTTPGRYGVPIYHYFKFEPIRWLVLQTDGESALIVSEKAIEGFNNSYDDISWERSLQRSLLNGYDTSENDAIVKTDYETGKTTFKGIDFTVFNVKDHAFTNEEQNAIETTYLSDTLTSDKLFYLSKDEVEKYLLAGTKCEITDYAKEMRGTPSNLKDSDDSVSWALRDKGCFVNGSTADFDSGTNVKWTAYRPALIINLSSAEWTYAGKVQLTSNTSTSAKTSGTEERNTVTDDNTSVTPDTQDDNTSVTPDTQSNSGTDSSSNSNTKNTSADSSNTQISTYLRLRSNTTSGSAVSTADSTANSKNNKNGSYESSENAPVIIIKGNKVTVKAPAKIRSLKLNKKTIAKAKGKTKYSFKISKYKKYLKWSGKNKIVVKDRNGQTAKKKFRR